MPMTMAPPSQPQQPLELCRPSDDAEAHQSVTVQQKLDQLRPQQWFNFVQQMVELPPGEGYMPPVDAPGLVEEMEDLLGPPF